MGALLPLRRKLIALIKNALIPVWELIPRPLLFVKEKGCRLDLVITQIFCGGVEFK